MRITRRQLRRMINETMDKKLLEMPRRIPRKSIYATETEAAPPPETPPYSPPDITPQRGKLHFAPANRFYQTSLDPDLSNRSFNEHASAYKKMLREFISKMQTYKQDNISLDDLHNRYHNYADVIASYIANHPVKASSPGVYDKLMQGILNVLNRYR